MCELRLTEADPSLNPPEVASTPPSRCSPELARRLAERIHSHGTDRYGSPLVPHVRRVVAAVPAEARAVAWLHETLEASSVSAEDLLVAGVPAEELAAIRLLTRDRAGEEADYLGHVALIAGAAGECGRLARIVKRADLLDRMRYVVSGAGVAPRPPHLQALAVLAAFGKQRQEAQAEDREPSGRPRKPRARRPYGSAQMAKTSGLDRSVRSSDRGDVEAFTLSLGLALRTSGAAVSKVQDHLLRQATLDPTCTYQPITAA